MNLREQRESALKAAQEIAGKAKNEGRVFTGEEKTQVEDLIGKADEIAGQIKAAEDTEALMSKAFTVPEGKPAAKPPAEGIHAKLAEDAGYASALVSANSRTRFSARTEEFEAKDFSTGMPADSGLVQTQYGRVVESVLRRPTVAGLFAAGTMSATTLTYYVQGPTTGGFTSVPELGEKPALDFGFEPEIETLTKIAGITKMSDESLQDTAYLTSVIEGQMMRLLAIEEENQLLNGTGAGTDMTGILNRAGVLTEASAGLDDNIDSVFRAMTAVELATQLPVDAVVVNPLDYQEMRLSRDANGQYFAGGPFTGAYGQGAAFPMNPSLWQQNTVVTSAIAQGTALVGSFGSAGQVLRKGGVSVEMTNTDGDDWRYNRIALRAEERLMLAVYQPAAFCEVTLTGAGS